MDKQDDDVGKEEGSDMVVDLDYKPSVEVVRNESDAFLSDVNFDHYSIIKPNSILSEMEQHILKPFKTIKNKK